METTAPEAVPLKEDTSDFRTNVFGVQYVN